MKTRIFAMCFILSFCVNFYQLFLLQSITKEIDITKKASVNIIKEQDKKIKYMEKVIEETKNKENSLPFSSPKYYEIQVKTTAYTSAENGDDLCPGNIMASGQECFVGAIAYNDVPLYTKVEIDGNIYTVHDRMLHDNTIDIYMDSYEDCINYGVQYKTVKVYYE